jgi:hypothetical protein
MHIENLQTPGPDEIRAVSSVVLFKDIIAGRFFDPPSTFQAIWPAFAECLPAIL